MKKFAAFGLLALSFLSSPASFGQTPLTADEINAAEFIDAMPEGVSALTVKLQVLLDRAGANPGVIDGVAGENVTRAIRGLEEINGLEVDGIMTPDLWERLRSPEPVAVTYTITAQDLEKIVPGIPADYAEMAKMEWLGFTSGAEALAEKFHMDQNFLMALNPFARFIIGESIIVINPGEQAPVVVTRIVADKSNERIVIYGENDRPVLVYPATIGSDSKPSPKGTHEVKGVAVFPTYAYNPDVNFQQAANTEKLTIPAGPQWPRGRHLDRPVGAHLRHPRNAGPLEDFQNRIARLRAAHQLGRGGTGKAGEAGDRGDVHRGGEVHLLKTPSPRFSGERVAGPLRSNGRVRGRFKL